MRMVGINTKSYSMFHQNLWCLGTVLPKHHGSRGDRKWHRELQYIPDALKLYLANDTSQPLTIFWTYAIIFAMNRFPDTLAVAHVTHGVTPRGLVTWICDNVILPISSHTRNITSSNNGIWKSCDHPPVNEPASNYESLISRINISEDHFLITSPPAWPSLTAGGPLLRPLGQTLSPPRYPLPQSPGPRVLASAAQGRGESSAAGCRPRDSHGGLRGSCARPRPPPQSRS